MKKVKNELINNLRYICLIVVVAFGLIGIVGSGGGGGGHSEYLSTVSLYANYDEGLYEADVMVKTDTTDNGECDTDTFFADEKKKKEKIKKKHRMVPDTLFAAYIYFSF